jgi:hypothetical protein
MFCLGKGRQHLPTKGGALCAGQVGGAFRAEKKIGGVRGEHESSAQSRADTARGEWETIMKCGHHDNIARLFNNYHQA